MSAYRGSTRKGKAMLNIPLFRPFIDEEEEREIKSVLNSGWLTMGAKVEEFEKRITKKLGVKHAIVCSSGTAALHLSLKALGVREGDEVLVADFTFPATGHAVMYCGAIPVFVDIDPLTYNLDIRDAKEKLSPRTKVIIPVHTFGQVAEMDDILKFAEENKIQIIEDAACAFGSKYKGHSAGTLGDLGCFSFHATKGITTGEGGCVTTNDDGLAKRVRNLLVYGIEKNTPWEKEKAGSSSLPVFARLGFNYKMSDISAACGCAQIGKLDIIVTKKRKLAEYWDKKLKGIIGIEPPYVESYNYHNYQSYCTLVGKNVDRDKVILLLKERGVSTQIGTYSSFIQPVYDSKDKCPTSLDVYNRALRLPLYFNLTEAEIDQVAEILEKVLLIAKRA